MRQGNGRGFWMPYEVCPSCGRSQDVPRFGRNRKPPWQSSGNKGRRRWQSTEVFAVDCAHEGEVSWVLAQLDRVPADHRHTTRVMGDGTLRLLVQFRLKGWTKPWAPVFELEPIEDCARCDSTEIVVAA